MSPYLRIDFSTVLPVGVRLPSCAIASIIELSEDGSPHPDPVTKRVPVSLHSTAKPTRVLLWRGRFLVQLQAPSGHVLTYVATIADEDEPLEMVPRQSQHSAPRHNSRERDKLHRLSWQEMSSAWNRSEDQVRSLALYEPLRISHPDLENLPTRAFRVSPPANLDTLSSRPSVAFLDDVSRRQDFIGLAKLRAQPNLDAFSSEIKQRDVLSALVGDIDMVQRVPLHGDTKHLHTAWYYPGPRDGTFYEDSYAHRGSRHYALSYQVKDDFKLCQLACLPGSWHSSDDEVVGVRVTTHPTSPQMFPRFRFEVEDAGFRGLIDFLQAGNLSAVLDLIGDARVTFDSGFNNPYFTAATLYALLYTDNTDEVQKSLFIPRILSLSHEYFGLPDFSILASTLLLQHPKSLWAGSLPSIYPVGSPSSLAEAAGWALHGVLQGPPLFRLGLELMEDNLEILAAEISTDDELAEKIRIARQYVRAMLLRVDPTQAFCVFDMSR